MPLRNARLLLACLALVGATAFAPAPFPRSRKAALEGVTVERIQGDWTILQLHMTEANGGKRDQGKSLSRIRIEKDRWTFCNSDPARPSIGYLLSIDPKRTPVAIDLSVLGQSKPYGTGIIRRKGNLMHVLYSFGKERPTGFENPPAGYWHLTLQFTKGVEEARP